MNAYVQAPVTEKVRTMLGPDFGKNATKIYGLNQKSDQKMK